MITFRQADCPAAKEAFGKAIEQADTLLGQTAQHYGALDTKALALCGLTLCDDSNHLSDAAGGYTISSTRWHMGIRPSSWGCARGGGAHTLLPDLGEPRVAEVDGG